MYDDIFLNYKNDSTEKLEEYFNQLRLLIKEKTNFDSPYISGKFPKNIIDFLEDKCMKNDISNPRDVIREMSQYFSGTTRWHHPYVMNNIKTPVNIVALAVIFNAIMIDPNLAGDTNCGQVAYAELEVIKYISVLIGWDWKKSGGYFTFGGTSTLLNAVKVSINKSISDVCVNGINEEVFIISSEQGHSAHADVCNWLGIGSENCFRIPVNSNYQMDINKAESLICEKIESGKKWIGIIACGGTTIQTIVDPILDIYNMRKRIVRKYKLGYLPHLHVDSVVGWIWLFYSKYNFQENELNLSEEVLTKIYDLNRLISRVKYADSIGIDFHKTGFCPYASSLFLTKNSEEIYNLNNKKPVPLEKIEYGLYSPSTYTLELSRSSTGPLSALTTLKLLGYRGYQILLRDIMEGVCMLRKKIEEDCTLEVINADTNGTCILFIIKPQGINMEYKQFPYENVEIVKEIALYNYKFYLYVLSKIKEEKIDFFIDYSSGYEKTRNGFHMGVLKMQTFNPMLSLNRAERLAKQIIKLKSEFDNKVSIVNLNTVYKPKTFKFKYENRRYVIVGGKICLKK